MLYPNSIWIEYKLQIRSVHPKAQLFNHWKFFNMLCVYAHEVGVLRVKLKLDYDKSEDRVREGYCIPNEDIEKMIGAASQDWKDRIYLGRVAGPRPGEIRCLQKDRVDFERKMINLRSEDTKTREARSFFVEDDEFWAILKRRRNATNSRYFFPGKASKALM